MNSRNGEETKVSIFDANTAKDEHDLNSARAIALFVLALGLAAAFSYWRMTGNVLEAALVAGGADILGLIFVGAARI